MGKVKEKNIVPDAIRHPQNL